jgi:uncharacterized protein (TIGR02145 family)
MSKGRLISVAAVIVVAVTTVVLSQVIQGDTRPATDGTVYASVKIGDQWWMAENLRATHYRNGDLVPHITDKAQWAALTTGAYSEYDNDADHVAAYGRLYNAYAVQDIRGLCPQGWHVPTDEEWKQLEVFLGMSSSEANRMTAWRGKNEGQLVKSADFGGDDTAGFGARGTGYRDPRGIYRAEHSDNNYWTATTFDNNGSVESILHGLTRRAPTIVRNFHVQTYGFSVRCMRN